MKPKPESQTVCWLNSHSNQLFLSSASSFTSEFLEQLVWYFSQPSLPCKWMCCSATVWYRPARQLLNYSNCWLPQLVRIGGNVSPDFATCSFHANCRRHKNVCTFLGKGHPNSHLADSITRKEHSVKNSHVIMSLSCLFLAHVHVSEVLLEAT